MSQVGTVVVYREPAPMSGPGPEGPPPIARAAVVVAVDGELHTLHVFIPGAPSATVTNVAQGKHAGEFLPAKE